MKRQARLLICLPVGIGLLLVLLPQPVLAVPTTLDWGSFDASGSADYGVYDRDNLTILETGDLAQLVWAGPDGQVDPPNGLGDPSGDDVLLDANSIQNDEPLPPPLQNRGYVPLKTFTFDTDQPMNGGVVYIRAWNAATPWEATAYGDSIGGKLVSGGTFIAPRWYTAAEFEGEASVFLPITMSGQTGPDKDLMLTAICSTRRR